MWVIEREEVNGLLNDTTAWATSSLFPVESNTFNFVDWTSFCCRPGNVEFIRTAENAGFNEAIEVESS